MNAIENTHVELESFDEKVKRGEALFAEGKLDEAERCFLSVVEDDKKNQVAYNNLGVVAIEKGDLQSAIECFARSLEIEPSYSDALTNYINLLKTMNQQQIAVPLLEKLIEMKPEDTELVELLDSIRLN